MCKAHLSPVRLMRQGNHFYIEADLFLSYEQLEDSGYRLLVPVLSDGEHRIELPLLLVAGRTRYRSLRWALWRLGGNILSSYRIKQVLRGINRTSCNYLYRTRLSYRDWMDQARLSLMQG